MTPEQRERAIEILRAGEELDPEWHRLLFPPGRREYELIYGGKERAEEIIAETLAVPLQPVRTFGRNVNSWQNMLIFGDNLQVMKTLLEMKGRGELANADGSPGVRLVYIDPPFATKQDFRSSQDQKAYQDKIAGALFLEFLRKRLVMIRELLADDGSLFVHLDARKGHYVKVLLDEVFGEANFRNEVVLKRRITKNLQRQFDRIQALPVAHDTLYWYTKQTSRRVKPIMVSTESTENGYWHHFWSGADRPTMRYELLGVTPSSGQWKWQRKRALGAVANYKRYEREAKGRSLVEYWRDTGEEFQFMRLGKSGKVENWYPPSTERIGDTIWLDIHAYPNTKVYPTEKDEALLERVVELGSEGEGDIVLDCFAGSGTAAAVAEKMGRRWIAIDCGKLATYTIQKRMLNLRAEIGNKKGRHIKPKPFTLSNAGLYDFSRLRNLPWEDWRFFALQLFQCKDESHKIGGVELDGRFKGASVLVFNHFEFPDAKVTYHTIADLHEAIGRKIGRKFFIIAPALCFAFQEDYVDRDGIRYYALRIPYSIIHELHRRDFTKIRQPRDEAEVNETVDAVGFDFIRTPEAKISYRIKKPSGKLFIKVTTFKSEVVSRSLEPLDNLESLSVLMIDVDYDGEVFDLDYFVFAGELRDNGFAVDVPADDVGDRIMVVLLDIYGNEFREVKSGAELGLAKTKAARTPHKKRTSAKRATKTKRGRRVSKHAAKKR